MSEPSSWRNWHPFLLRRDHSKLRDGATERLSGVVGDILHISWRCTISPRKSLCWSWKNIANSDALTKTWESTHACACVSSRTYESDSSISSRLGGSRTTSCAYPSTFQFALAPLTSRRYERTYNIGPLQIQYTRLSRVRPLAYASPHLPPHFYSRMVRVRSDRTPASCICDAVAVSTKRAHA